MARQKNVTWNCGDGGREDQRHTALLMDLRDELKQLSESINAIRHFFHQPGMAAAIRAEIARANRREKERRARLKASRA